MARFPRRLPWHDRATGPNLPDPAQITFFGPARTFKARFPFQFGERRLAITGAQLLPQVAPQCWEGRGGVGMPFAIGAVARWIGQGYRDHIG